MVSQSIKFFNAAKYLETLCRSFKCLGSQDVYNLISDVQGNNILIMITYNVGLSCS